MILIMIKNGTEAGGKIVPAEDDDPIAMLKSFLALGIQWHICYGEATYKEKMQWGSIDLEARCVRALKNFRPIIFNGKTFQLLSESKQEFERVSSELEHAICSVEKFLYTERDDATGLVIGTEMLMC